MSKLSRYFVFLAYGSLFCFGLIDNIRGPFLPETMADLSLTGTSSSLYFAFTSLACFIFTLLSPILLKKWTAVNLLFWSNVFLALAFFGLSQSADLPALLCLSFAVGTGFGGLNLSQNVVIHEAAPLAIRRRLFSGLHSMYGASALAAPLLASLFRWLNLDWRQAFGVIAMGPFVMALSSLPGRHFRAKDSGNQETPKLTRREWISCGAFAVIVSFYLMGEISASTRLVLWLRSERGFSPDLANIYLAGFSVLLLAGRIAFTLYHFKLSSANVLRISAGLSALLYAAGLIFSPLFLVLSGFAMAPFYPVAMDYVVERFGRKSSAALSIVLGFGSLSVVMMHAMLGVISDWKSLSYALWMGPVGLALIVVIFWPWCFSSQRVTIK